MLVLYPGAVARAGQVCAAEPLGDHALQTLFAGRGQHLVRLGYEVARRPPARPVERQIKQQLTPVLVGKPAGRVAIEVKHVKHQKGGRCPLGMSTRLVGRGAQPSAEAGEVGAVVGPQADELAVEQHAVASKAAGDGRELGELLGAVPAGRERRHTARPSRRS